jgi:hypothetical protein
MAFPPGAHVLHLSGIARSDDGAPTAIKYLLSNLRPKPVEQPVMNQTGALSCDINFSLLAVGSTRIYGNEPLSASGTRRSSLLFVQSENNQTMNEG